jgi:hypothetical protein
MTPEVTKTVLNKIFLKSYNLHSEVLRLDHVCNFFLDS